MLDVSRSWARRSHSSVDRRSDSTSTRSSSPWNMVAKSSKSMLAAEEPEAVRRWRRPAEEAGVGRADGEERDRRALRARAAVTRPSASHSGVSIGDAVDGSSIGGDDLHRRRRGRRERRRAWPRRRRPSWPGSVRMSTWRSTRSGMTLVFVPPCTTVGAKRGVRAGVEPGGPGRWGSASSSSIEAVLGSSSGSVELGREAPCPRRSGARSSWISVGGPVLGDAADDLGRLHQRVVGAERLRRVARRAPDAQRAPVACPSRRR